MKPKITSTGYWEGETAHLCHACSQPLATWIAGYLQSRRQTPVYDFGCGTGRYLKVLAEHGFSSLLGFEGDPPLCADYDRILRQDLTEPFSLDRPGNVVCLEVGEHVPPEYEQTFLDNITEPCGGALVLSWAVRGQGGDGHVNCLNNEEVIGRIERRGFAFLSEETRAARAVITDLPWFKNTIMVFTRARASRGRG